MGNLVVSVKSTKKHHTRSAKQYGIEDPMETVFLGTKSARKQWEGFLSVILFLCVLTQWLLSQNLYSFISYLYTSLSLLQFSRWGSDCAGFIRRSIHARRRVWMDGISLGSSLCFFYSMEVIRNGRKMYLDNISNFKTLSQIYYYRFLIWIYKLLLVGKKIILVMNSNKKPVTIC